MTRDPARRLRRSIRLQAYDYSQAGAYFITICTQDRACLFGEVVDGEMRLNDVGRMTERWWLELERKFSSVETDEYVVMPNHFHGVVVIGAQADHGAHADQGAQSDQGAHIGAPLHDGVGGGVGADLCVCPGGAHANAGAHADHGAPSDQGAHIGAPLPAVIQWFKTMTTNEYIRGVKTLGWQAFRGRVWQRNYYERVIRDEESLDRIREYIVNNPLQWASDTENPDAVSHGQVTLPKDDS